MAIAFTNKVGGATVGDGPYVTASWTPTNGRLYLLTCQARTNLSVDTVQPSVSGNGITWVLVADIVYDTASASRKRLSVFRGLVSSGATAGQTTITYTGQAQTAGDWVIDEVTGMDTTGTNGSGAIVQTITGKDETLTQTVLTLTLPSAIGSGNATWGAFAEDTAGITATAGTGYTLLGSSADGTYLVTATEYKVAGSTTVSITWSAQNSDNLGGIGIEIKAASAIASNRVLRIVHHLKQLGAM